MCTYALHMIRYLILCSHALLGMCLHCIGQYYLVVGKYKEAAESFSEALDIAKVVYGEDDLQVRI